MAGCVGGWTIYRTGHRADCEGNGHSRVRSQRFSRPFGGLPKCSE
jgi:hypothetical protein